MGLALTRDCPIPSRCPRTNTSVWLLWLHNLCWRRTSSEIASKNRHCRSKRFWFWSWKGKPTQKKTPTQIETQFEKQFRDNLCELSPLFPLKQAEKQAERVSRTVCVNNFSWVGGFWGGLPSHVFWCKRSSIVLEGGGWGLVMTVPTCSVSPHAPRAFVQNGWDNPAVHAASGAAAAAAAPCPGWGATAATTGAATTAAAGPARFATCL